MKIREDVLDACKDILGGAYNTCRFTRHEFGYLDKIIDWFYKQSKDEEEVSFLFELTLRGDDEKEIFSITYEGALEIYRINSVYDPEAGSDHYTSYHYYLDNQEENEEGQIWDWHQKALEALNFIDDDGSTLEAGVSFEHWGED